MVHRLEQELWLNIRAMDGRVATSRPATSHLEQSCMIDFADEKLAARHTRALHLSVAAEAKVGVALGEQFAVHRTMRIVADRAALAQGLVLEDERLGLFPMTLRAGFIAPRHGQAARGFEDVRAVRVVALHAIHAPLDDGMMVGQGEFGVYFEVALKTGGGIFAGIEDEAATTAADLDVAAARAVAGFTAALAGHRRGLHVDSRVRAGRENPDVIGVTIETGLVAHVMRAGDFRRIGDQVWRGRTGVQQTCRHARKPTGHDEDQKASFFWLRFLGHAMPQPSPAAHGCPGDAEFRANLCKTGPLIGL
jgi:hypothetical protein